MLAAVCVPHWPSALRLVGWSFWKASTAACVFGPNLPSTPLGSHAGLLLLLLRNVSAVWYFRIHAALVFHAPLTGSGPSAPGIVGVTGAPGVAGDTGAGGAMTGTGACGNGWSVAKRQASVAMNVCGPSLPGCHAATNVSHRPPNCSCTIGLTIVFFVTSHSWGFQKAARLVTASLSGKSGTHPVPGKDGSVAGTGVCAPPHAGTVAVVTGGGVPGAGAFGNGGSFAPSFCLRSSRNAKSVSSPAPIVATPYFLPFGDVAAAPLVFGAGGACMLPMSRGARSPASCATVLLPSSPSGRPCACSALA